MLHHLYCQSIVAPTSRRVSVDLPPLSFRKSDFNQLLASTSNTPEISLLEQNASPFQPCTLLTSALNTLSAINHPTWHPTSMHLAGWLIRQRTAQKSPAAATLYLAYPRLARQSHSQQPTILFLAPLPIFPEPSRIPWIRLSLLPRPLAASWCARDKASIVLLWAFDYSLHGESSFGTKELIGRMVGGRGVVAADMRWWAFP